MKNIHVLSTDKPSKLFKTGNFLLLDSKAMPNNTLETMNQHIYITSDEEIKDKCYVLSEISIGPLYLDGVVNTASMLAEGEWKKIILTTDPNLIKDGVQAIDDEFLKWFVKNPSCDFVEVESFIRYNPIVYQIILPKPKQETLEEFINSQPYYGTCTIEYKEGIEVGAKWQAERMYQSMKECWYAACAYSVGSHKEFKQTHPNFKEWFEQFKKKHN